MNSSVILFNNLFLFIAIVIIEANSANCQSSDGLSFPGEADLVLSLPNVSLPVGQNYSSVRHYSGYLQTSEKFDSSNVPYWFFESESENWQTQPVVLWLGGYVSALHQALTGISPIRMNVNGSLYLNEHSWNKNANLLILDQFPEVGIPSINWTLIMTNDTMAAEFALDALENFYGKFPNIFENPFYIAGEGLVSFHIGILAKLLVEKQFPPNFKGIIIGNGVYNLSDAVNAHFQYIYKKKKDLYENEFWENLKSLCCPKKFCSVWSKASLLNELPLKPMHHGVQDMVYDTKTVGHRTRFCGGLTFYSITGAGHSVAEDTPAVALEMLREFLYKEHFTNSVNHWLTDCPQTVLSCSFCTTEPTSGRRDGFSDFWTDSLYRYYADYKETM